MAQDSVTKMSLMCPTDMRSLLPAFSVQKLLNDISGDSLDAVWTQVKNKPFVIEEARINF
jgi:hypothetical protein